MNKFLSTYSFLIEKIRNFEASSVGGIFIICESINKISYRFPHMNLYLQDQVFVNYVPRESSKIRCNVNSYHNQRGM